MRRLNYSLSLLFAVFGWGLPVGSDQAQSLTPAVDSSSSSGSALGGGPTSLTAPAPGSG